MYEGSYTPVQMLLARYLPLLADCSTSANKHDTVDVETSLQFLHKTPDDLLVLHLFFYSIIHPLLSSLRSIAAVPPIRMKGSTGFIFFEKIYLSFSVAVCSFIVVTPYRNLANIFYCLCIMN